MECCRHPFGIEGTECCCSRLGVVMAGHHHSITNGTSISMGLGHLHPLIKSFKEIVQFTLDKVWNDPPRSCQSVWAEAKVMVMVMAMVKMMVMVMVMVMVIEMITVMVMMVLAMEMMVMVMVMVMETISKLAYLKSPSNNRGYCC